MKICDWSNSPPMASMGDTIRRLREKKEMSQEELAAAAELSRATIQKIEKNKTRDNQGKTIRKLAKALGMEPEDLRAAARDPKVEVIVWEADGVRRQLPAGAAGALAGKAADQGCSLAEWLIRLAEKSTARTRPGAQTKTGIVQTKTGQTRAAGDTAGTGARQ